MDPVVVTASRIDTTRAIQPREAYRMNRGQIELAPAMAVTDLFQYSGGCDIARRGGDGIQTDFSIRGSSFEQVLVLLDGIRMNNPQTGHHNANLPVAMADVDRIEVLAGHGSSLYGSSGFGGVIQVLTQWPANNQFRMGLQGGSHRTALGNSALAFHVGPLSSMLQFEKSKSDGYRFDSDYDVTSFSYRSSLHSGNSRLWWSFSQQEKDFGANGFYANYPSRENTLAQQGRIGFETNFWSDLKIQSHAYVNRHKDFFLLDVNFPNGYQNRHTTWVSGAILQASGRISKNMEFTTGVEGTDERMNSSRLGRHQRLNLSLWNETAFLRLNPLLFNIGWRWDFWENRRTQFNPSVGAVYAFSSGFRWKVSAGRVFRYPNFTELYYSDPANQGDPNLKSESGWCGETGWVWTGRNARAEMTVFRRDEHNRIDWIKQTQSEPWRVANLPQNTVSGMSFSCGRLFGNTLSLAGSFTAMRFSASSDRWSKYMSNSLERLLNVSATVQWPWNLRQGIFMILKKRQHADAVACLDSKITRRWKSLTFFLSGTNLTNTRYEDIPGIPMPGARFMAGSTLVID